MTSAHADASGASAEPNPGELLTALTTEHFTLQGARSRVMAESSSRAALYISAVSSTLIALGFIGQVSDVGDAFNVFALVVLPTLYVLGLFTLVRLVECDAEDLFYGLAINRIRHYYKQRAGEHAKLFMLSGYDDAAGAFASMGMRLEGRKSFFTFGTVIVVINSVIVGTTAALAVRTVAGASLAASVVVGAAAAIISLVVLRRIAAGLIDRLVRGHEVLFPSPDSPLT
jgi:hypothetical protein